MAYRDYELIAAAPQLAPDGHWWWTLCSNHIKNYGPFSTEKSARAHRERTFKRLQSRAQRRGGWGWRSTHRKWHVTLPPEVPCDAPLLKSAPCTRHGSPL